jgi:hypothetical protein
LPVMMTTTFVCSCAIALLWMKLRYDTTLDNGMTS